MTFSHNSCYSDHVMLAQTDGSFKNISWCNKKVNFHSEVGLNFERFNPSQLDG